MARSPITDQLGIRVRPETKRRAVELYHMGRAMGRWRNWDEAMQVLLELGRMYLEGKLELPGKRIVL